ncbi:hypothetical protein [Helicobacter apodemus]|nr:hypothetical protein [Helicobacter apodemus]
MKQSIMAQQGVILRCNHQRLSKVNTKSLNFKDFMDYPNTSIGAMI